MRILLMHHFPLGDSRAGRLTRQWAQALEQAAHDVRLLVVDDRPHVDEHLTIERVVCSADTDADLPFDLPRFASDALARKRFSFRDLSSAQLAAYRDHLRRRLDGLVERFDPHVIHVQHIWILGQLALETGVPYVINGWESELAELARDERYGGLAEQAAENAGRILLPDDDLRRRVSERFETLPERLLLMPPGLLAEDADRGSLETQLSAIYRAVLAERFGSDARVP